MTILTDKIRFGFGRRWGDGENVCEALAYCMLQPTCVVEECGDEGAVPEEGVAGGDVLKVAFLKQGVLKHHRLHLQVYKPDDDVIQGMCD